MTSLKEFFTRFRVGKMPDPRSELPITPVKDEIVTGMLDGDSSLYGQFNQFRQLSDDRQIMYEAYDDMKTDSVIAAALEIYADDATQTDENGRVVWVESEDENITKAANRLLDIFEIPERAWKHVYMSCLYGDYYLKLYRHNYDDSKEKDEVLNPNQVHVVNDVVDYKGHKDIPEYDEYVEDVRDPATIFDLRKRGKTAGFVEIVRTAPETLVPSVTPNYNSVILQFKDIQVYRPDRLVHIMVGENTSRIPETVSIDLGDGTTVEYESARGKSVLQDVYPIQKELQLLEDSLLLNRLTRSALIRILEVELGDMPKKEVNNYTRRLKQIIEQHISLDKGNGKYKSFNAPGPIDNVIYIPVRNGKGHIDINNLGGDVNIRDIADIDYFNNKRAGALKIPRGYLGDDMSGTGLDNGGSLTRLSIRYARTIKRIQQSYIRAITTLLNLFFVDKNLDYVNKFQVRMTSPSTQEDLERNELINGNIDLVSNIMDLTESLEGSTQKKILTYLVANIMKMPEISTMIKEDQTPSEEIDIQGGEGGPNLDINMSGPGPDESDISAEFEEAGSEGESESETGGFSEEDFQSFEDF